MKKLALTIVTMFFFLLLPHNTMTSMAKELDYIREYMIDVDPEIVEICKKRLPGRFFGIVNFFLLKDKQSLLWLY